MKGVNAVKNLTFHRIIVFILGLFVFSLFINACSEDDSASSDLGSVSGTITFDNVFLWPDSGEVQVTIFPANVWQSFGAIGPPQNANTPVILTKSGNQTQYQFTIDGLPEGDYSSLAVGWRRPNVQNYPAEKRTATLGVYWNDPDSVSLGLSISQSPLNYPLPTVISLAKGENKT